MIDKIGKYVEWLIETHVIYHLIFWLVFYFFMIVMAHEEVSLSYAMLVHLISVVIYAFIVYFNLIFLFPKYLRQNKIISYLIWITLTAFVVASVRILIVYFISDTPLEFGKYYMSYLPSFALVTFFIGSSSSIYNIVSDWFLHQREKLDLHRRSLRSELNFLKSQINPHFLFNTLNSLYALTLKKSDLAPEIVLRLSEMMRYMLYECNERQVPLSKEINYIENYLELEKIRHGNKYKIEFSKRGEVTNQKIAPLLFIPFIENSFKHGIGSNAKEGYVNIVIVANQESVHVSVENSKAPSLPSINHKKSGGIGLVNVKRRLDLMYPNDYELAIDESPDQYKVNLNINL